VESEGTAFPLLNKIQAYKGKVYCIDLLPSAITLLNHYAEHYGVTDTIVAHTVDVENFLIKKNAFDYIIACSCLEHSSSETAFLANLNEMKARDGNVTGLHLQLKTGD
jgi:2-polyprenyl-3-methyl-5-hydroxy-6-metoxy-1,4-benzoquinol methylase